MGFQEKGTTWIGDIGKKFETFCSGIDSIVSQDTFEYAENQLLTAGENVKQFCSEFMQEMLPDFLKDTPSDLQETEERDLSACDFIKNDADEGYKTGLSNSNSSLGSFPVETAKDADTDSLLSGKSFDGKEMGLEENLLNVTLFPSKTAEIEASENDALGIISLVSRVNPSHDTGFDGLTHQVSVTCQSSFSSPKAGATSDPIEAKVDSSTILHSAIVSAGSDKGKFLENEDSSSGDALSGTLSNLTDVDVPSFSRHSFQSLGEPFCEFAESEEVLTFSNLDDSDDSKIEQRKGTQTSAIAMDVVEPFNILTIDGSCILVDVNKICPASDSQAKYVTSQAGRSRDNNAVSHRTGENCLSTSTDQDFCESDWEII